MSKARRGVFFLYFEFSYNFWADRSFSTGPRKPTLGQRKPTLCSTEQFVFDLEKAFDLVVTEVWVRHQHRQCGANDGTLQSYEQVQWFGLLRSKM
jgi:hypothetical protein